MQGTWNVSPLPPNPAVFEHHRAHVSDDIYNGGGENTFQAVLPDIDMIRHIVPGPAPGCGNCPGLVPSVQDNRLTIPADFCAWVATWWTADIVAQHALANGWFREPGAETPHDRLLVMFKFLNLVCLHVRLNTVGAGLQLVRRVQDDFIDVQVMLPGAVLAPAGLILAKCGREIKFLHVAKFAHPDLFSLQHLLDNHNLQAGDFVECHSKKALCRMCDFVFGRVLVDLAVVLLVQVDSPYNKRGPFRSRMPPVDVYPSWYQLNFGN